MSQPWVEPLARFIDAHPEFAAYIERRVADDIPLVNTEYHIGCRQAWLEIYRWYKREVRDVRLEGLAARGSPGQPGTG